TYVRVGFVSDVEWSDDEPSDVRSFFIRQARWTRGDFQLLPWLLLRVKNRAGKKVRNPIGVLGRVKIAETLFRSLMPAGMMFTAAATAVGADGFGYFPFCMMLFNLSLPVWGSVIGRIREKKRARLFSNQPGSVARSAFFSFMRFSLIPFEAMLNVSCAAISIWRMAVTKRDLLQWSSTQLANKRSDGIGGYLKFMFACPLTSAAILFFSHTPLAAAVSAVFAAAPFFSYAVSRRGKTPETLSSDEKNELRAQARLMWGYFKDLLTPRDNFLIPDNFQTEPYAGAAHRTSPTNIGLSLISVLSAYDFGFIEKGELFSYAESIIKSVKRLEKYLGHLYNWYDTRTASVLPPRYVSTVDSGNFTGCLIALKAGLKHAGAPEGLLSDIEALIEGADFGALYSPERRLFYVGFNESEGEHDPAYYDLLASEARQTSFIACALHHVPPKHWSALSRECAGAGGRGGLYSWTGTMFEYFMPALFMPPYYNSLIHESLRFSVFCQRLRVGRGSIFGISESAYCAFDGGFSYRYKAFGVPALAKKRDADGSLVISPYSSYLSLMTNPRESFLNLIRMKGTGAEGIYGFYEALDFENAARGEVCAPVKTYMAHHLGMSMAACANAVFGGVMQRRFMSDERMRAFADLLKERPEIVPNRRRRTKAAKKTRPPRGAAPAGGAHFTHDMDAFAPRADVIGSGRFSSVITDSGAGFTRFEGLGATRRGFHAEDAKGIFFFAGERDAGLAMGLTFAPAYDKTVDYGVKFFPHRAEFTAKGYGLFTSLHVMSGAGRPLEIREALTVNGGEERAVFLSLYFEPILAPFSQDEDHRAFSVLFIETSYIESDRLVIVKRRGRDGEEGDVYLVAAFYGDTDALFVTTARDSARGRLSGAGELPREAEDAKKAVFGGVIDPCVFARTEKTLYHGGALRLGAVIAAGGDLSELLKLSREYRDAKARRALAREALARAAAESDIGRFTADLRERAIDILPALYMNMPSRDGAAEHIIKNTRPRTALWKYAVSGDLPIMLYELS
ncbi:MAG: hypothetical protein II705_03035, partial [Clostridia bacterium]|nr:hypothetical protein [Clostridia bacterium]